MALGYSVFILLSLCISVLEVPIDIASSTQILLTMFNLFMSPQKAFFISVTLPVISSISF